MITRTRLIAAAASTLALLLCVLPLPAQTVRPANPPTRGLKTLPEVTDLTFHKQVTTSPTATVIVFSGDDDATSVAQNTVLADLADSYAGRVNFVHARLVRAPGDGGFSAPDAIHNLAAAARLHFVPTLLFVSNNHCNTVSSVG